MKALADIRRDKRVRIIEAHPDDGCRGFVQIGHGLFKFIASWGGAWDHVSISRDDRTPRWEEMCAIRDLFFAPEECVVQYHPPHSRYVNVHQHCLHLRRPQTDEVPMPPLVYV